MILEGGQHLSTGNYELIGRDNCFHGCTVCKWKHEQRVDTGTPVTVNIQIPVDSSSYTISLDKDAWYMHDREAKHKRVLMRKFFHLNL